MKTAQILIVGDEILSGRTADTNSHFLARELFARGVRVTRIEVVPDSEILISQWIEKNHALADFLFVCGGIGGTPDDMTRPAVARACGVQLSRNNEAEKILLKYYGDRANPDRMSMADLPEGCVLIPNPVTHAPGFQMKNISVFAGVPGIMKAMWEQIQDQFQGEKIFEEELNLKVGEGEIARHMKLINREFPKLELGSYPTIDPSRPYKTQLVFKSTEESVVSAAVLRFKKLCEGLDAFV